MLSIIILNILQDVKKCFTRCQLSVSFPIIGATHIHYKHVNNAEVCEAKSDLTPYGWSELYMYIELSK